MSQGAEHMQLSPPTKILVPSPPISSANIQNTLDFKSSFVLQGVFFCLFVGFFSLYLHRDLCAGKSLHVCTSFRLFTDGEYKSERLNGKEDGSTLKQGNKSSDN